MASLLLLSLLFSAAASRNVTIDDESGDVATGRLVSYSPPSGAWEQGAKCTGCLLQPDPGQVMDGTWHDSTYGGQAPGPYSFTLLFDGDAIYVYCVLADGVPFATTATSLEFTLDDQPGGTFIWNPDNSVEKYTYNALVYGNTNIGSTATGSSGLHNLTVQSLAAILFDYAIYTVPDPPTSSVPSSLSTTSSTSTSPSPSPSPSSTSSTSSASSSTTAPATSHKSSDIVGPAVGGAVGGVVLIAALLLLALCWRRKYRTRKNHLTLDLLGGEASPTDAPLSSAEPLMSSREAALSATNTSAPTTEATLSSTDALMPLRVVPLTSPGASSSSMSRPAAGHASSSAKSRDVPSAIGSPLRPHDEQSDVSTAVNPSSRVRPSWTTTGLETEVAVLRQQVALLTQSKQWEEDEAPPQYHADSP